MEFQNSHLVERFVHQHINERMSFNHTDHSGDHTGFIIGAAKRRGLRVERVAPQEYMFFDQSIAIGGLTRMVTSLVGMQAVRLSASKPIMKNLFENAHVPIADGRTFKQSEYEEALQYFSESERFQVVKPSSGNGGEGITTNITSQEEFARAWQVARKSGSANNSIIVEDHIDGLDIRAFVVGEDVVAAATRLPAFVQGDGEHSMGALIEAEIDKRKNHAYLARLPISVDEVWLREQNISMKTIPCEGQVVTLNGTVNLHQGGEQVDVTPWLSRDLKEMAVRATKALPGLAIAGVDLLVKSLDDAESAVVLEVNHSANINVHHLPAYGDPVDVGAAIIDEMIRQSRFGRLLHY